MIKDPICKSCEQEFSLRQDTESTGYCDDCAQKRIGLLEGHLRAVLDRCTICVGNATCCLVCDSLILKCGEVRSHAAGCPVAPAEEACK
jgi:hypothetical protein